MQGMDGSWRVGLTDRVAQNLAHSWYNLCCLAYLVVTAQTDSCAALRSRRKAVPEAGGRSDTNRVTEGGRQTYVGDKFGVR